MLLRDLIFVFQGIEGRYILFDKEQDGFFVTDKELISKPVREMVAKMAEMGWMYKRIQKFIDNVKQEVTVGLVGQVQESLFVMI